MSINAPLKHDNGSSPEDGKGRGKRRDDRVAGAGDIEDAMGFGTDMQGLGIAFDNYDAIGRWRTVETVRDGTGADPALDPSGALGDGRKFSGFRSYRQPLRSRLAQGAVRIAKSRRRAIRRKG